MTQNNDALLNDLGVIINRTALFIIISLFQAIVLWLWLWMKFENWTLIQSARYLANAWPLSTSVFPSVVAIAAIWISAANTSILYLLLGRWWKKRSDVLHRRGSRFIDDREEK